MGLRLGCEPDRDDPLALDNDPVVDRVEQVRLLVSDVGRLPRLRRRLQPLDGASSVDLGSS